MFNLRIKNKLPNLLISVLLIIILAHITSKNVSAAVNCNFIVPLNVNSIDGSGNYSTVKPGDKVCIQSGNRSSLTIQNIIGNSSNPITFVNTGGIVSINNSGFAGIYIKNSKFIKVTGTGVSDTCGASFSEGDQQCGFVITGNQGRGVSVREKPSFAEIDHIEVKNTSESGIGSQEDTLTRSEWTLDNLNFHHNYVHDTTIDEGSEGFYIGSSSYTVSGSTPLVKNINVSHNLVARTGWDGIQVGSAVENCNIHHNKIIEDSRSAVSSQMSAVMVNKGSVCNVYNNFISDSGWASIYVQGNGNNKIYNNIILRSGRLVPSGGASIRIGTGSNTGNDVYILNNTIVDSGEDGIKFSFDLGSSSKIQNNIVINSKNSNINIGSRTNVQVSNNISGNSITDTNLNNNYQLLSNSPAINSGLDVSTYKITYDYADKLRPYGTLYDIGAYEYQGTNQFIIGDFDKDGDVDIYDLNALITNFGKRDTTTDTNNNGVVDIFDFNKVLSNFSK